MLIPDKFYRYYNDTYTPPIDMVFLGLEGNRFKIIMDSANGKHNGRTLPRTMFSDYYTFQKLYND